MPCDYSLTSTVRVSYAIRGVAAPTQPASGTMPPPSTVSELLDRVRRSGIVSADRLDGFVAANQSVGTSWTIPSILERMVDTGLITRFHSEKLAAGKYKGFQLGNYLILDQIGTGGMGQVYLAEHTNMRRLVALKVLPVFSADDAIARERFFREARAAGTLDHPNIVRVFDLCQEGKLLYLVMEYVEGISLQGVVGRHGPLPIEIAADYVGQVAFGLQHAAELGFVHRDIKPANLLLDRFGVVKILDLGLVRSQADNEAGLTRKLDNKILGTADYVAPEQAINSSDVDIRADIYSLGATFYFLLTGRTLFPEGRTAQKLVYQQIREPVPVHHLRHEVNPDLSSVVHRMLQKRPADRYQTPEDVFNALAPFVPEGVPPPDPSWMPESSARVAMARAGTSPRATGSTSQIFAAALRGDAGSARRTPTRGTGDSSFITMTRPTRNREDTTPTRAVALDDTHGPDLPDPADLPARSGWVRTAFLILAVALLLASIMLGTILLLHQ